MRFNTKALLFVSLLACSSASMLAKAEVMVHTCACYSANSFVYAAEQYSMAVFPEFTGINEVYIVNPQSGETKFFHVYHSIDGSFQPNAAIPSPYGSRSPDPSIANYFMVDAVEATPNPSVISDIHDALSAVQQLSYMMAEGAGPEDFPELADYGINSAIDLLGPHDSAAGYRRIVLANRVRQHLDGLMQSFSIALRDTAWRLVVRFMGDATRVQMLSAFSVRFPDGSEIELRIDEILADVDGVSTTWILTVLPETATVPGLIGIPSSSGQFNGFQASVGAGTIQDLAELAERYGLTVSYGNSGGPSGGGGGCVMDCEVSGSELTCQVSCSTP